jgi:hypothetical protein
MFYACNGVAPQVHRQLPVEEHDQLRVDLTIAILEYAALISRLMVE